MPAHLAARKWPASWTKTSTPSTTIKDTSVSTSPSCSPHVVSCALARPAVGLLHHGEAAGGRRRVIVEHPLDDLADPPEWYLPGEERRHRHLVGGIEDGRAHAART